MRWIWVSFRKEVFTRLLFFGVWMVVFITPANAQEFKIRQLGQEVKAAPLDIRGGVGQPIYLTVGDVKQPVTWIVLDDGLTMIPPAKLANPSEAIFIAIAKGQYRVIAYSKSDRVAPASAILTIGDGPTLPPPDPDPLPGDALTKALREAWNKESNADKAKLATLVDIYRQAAKTAQDERLKTFKELNDVIKASREQLIGQALPNLRGVINTELQRSLAGSVSAVLDPTGRKLCEDTFNRVATALAKIVEGQ